MSLRQRLTARRRDAEPERERGAVLVEFALVATLLVTLVLGVLEVGDAWSDYQSLTQASRSGARVVSQMGTDAAADAEALLAVEASLGDQADNVTRIVVFEADGSGNMPSECETATVGYGGTANCNVYDATSLTNVTTPGWFGTSGGGCGSADGNWCPTARVDTLASATYVGVRVEVQRTYLTGLFGAGTHTITEATVMRVEPDIE